VFGQISDRQLAVISIIVTIILGAPSIIIPPLRRKIMGFLKRHWNAKTTEVERDKLRSENDRLRKENEKIKAEFETKCLELGEENKILLEKNEPLPKQFLLTKSRFTIEAAASLVVLDDIVTGEEWSENTEIQAAYEWLYEQAFAANSLFTTVYKSRAALTEISRQIEARFRSTEIDETDIVKADIIKKARELDCQKLLSIANLAFAEIRSKDKNVTWEKICTWLDCHDTNLYASSLADIIRDSISTSADPFGLCPTFRIIVDNEEGVPHQKHFQFKPVRGFLSDAPSAEGYVEVLGEGIRARLKFEGRHDKYFNPSSPTDDAADIAPKESPVA